MVRLTLSVKTLIVYVAVVFVMLTVLLAAAYTVKLPPNWKDIPTVELQGLLERKWETFIWFSIGGVLLTSIAAGMGLLYVRYKVAAPVNRLIDAARRLDRGERDVIIGRLGTGDELDELAEAFDEMSRDISKAWAHLESEVRSRTDDLERMNREVVRVNERLTETVKTKSEFLANMSHELRTPMNAVIGYAHCLLDGLDGPLNDEQRVDVQRILNGAESLLKLVNDLLDLSRMEAKRLEVRPEETPLSQIVEAVVSSVIPQAAKKEIEVRVEIPTDLRIFADPVRTRQVLLNIVANAVKFTEKGFVRIAGRRAGSRVEVEIEDTGIGIEKDDLDRIFETFVQVDTSQSRRHGGAGLGLAIARRLTELMGGALAVSSEFGRGSLFKVTLPSGPTPFLPAADSAPLVDGTVPTVVAVDDDPDALELIRRSLAPAGFAVVGARTGTEGLRLARLLQPAAITLDVMLPDRDGWDVLKELRADPTTGRIPVFLVTIVEDKPKGFALGAVEYLVKPVNRAVLAEKVRSFTGRLDGRTVIAVDDDEVDLELIRKVLRDVPCRLLAVRDPEEALRQVETERPALVLLDLCMPGMDGFTLLEHLRVRKETREIPVVVFTAKDLTADEVMRLRRLSAESILRKGTSTATDLVSEVRRVLASP